MGDGTGKKIKQTGEQTNKPEGEKKKRKGKKKGKNKEEGKRSIDDRATRAAVVALHSR